MAYGHVDFGGPTRDFNNRSQPVGYLPAVTEQRVESSGRKSPKVGPQMDEINPTFRETDVVLVIGANDVVNPMARENDPSIPIAGMPILDVDQAQVVVVIKRSLSPGFAGIPNPLFAADNALMLFGDAKQMVTELTSALKAM